jgi:hypothetical protein
MAILFMRLSETSISCNGVRVTAYDDIYITTPTMDRWKLRANDSVFIRADPSTIVVTADLDLEPSFNWEYE